MLANGARKPPFRIKTSQDSLHEQQQDNLRQETYQAKNPHVSIFQHFFTCFAPDFDLYLNQIYCFE